MNSRIVEVFPINTGTLDMSESTCFSGGSTEKSRTISVLAFLIVHPKYGNTLFDLGLSNDFRLEKFGRFEKDFDSILPYNPQLYRTVGEAISNLFNSKKIVSKTVKNIIISHSHWDHVGNINNFPNSSIFMSHHFEKIKIDTSNLLSIQ